MSPSPAHHHHHHQRHRHHLLLALAVCLVTLATPPPCSAQFPRACTSSANLVAKICCPPWPGDGSPCGEATARGSCELVVPSTEPHGPGFPFAGVDDRELWPTAFYSRMCRCRANYWGHDCGECSFGWRGPACTERPSEPSLRRNLMLLSAGERRKFFSYINLAKVSVHPEFQIAAATLEQMGNGTRPAFRDVSVFDLFVWMHYYASRDALLVGPVGPVAWPGVDFAHEGPGFAPWHRVFLLMWEREIRKLTGDEDFTIPYWDWRDAQDCEVCTDDFFGGRHPSVADRLSPASVFSAWQVICTRPDDYNRRGVLCDGSPEGPVLRNPGRHDPARIASLPTSVHVESCLGLVDFDTAPLDRDANRSFRNTLEGFADPLTGMVTPSRRSMHNSLHIFMNGSMSSVQGSANDPIFTVHHTFVDSLYERWLRAHGANASAYPARGSPIGQNGGDFMVPFLPLVTNVAAFVPSRELGYEYEYLQPGGEGSWFTRFQAQLQELWPWVVGALLLGALLASLLGLGAWRACRLGVESRQRRQRRGFLAWEGAQGKEGEETRRLLDDVEPNGVPGSFQTTF
ncbi:tyrosinase [Lampetra fluviatilis]